MIVNSFWEQISIYIQTHMEQKKNFSYGILGGDMGMIYLLFVLNKMSVISVNPDKYLMEVLRTLHFADITYSYCNGIAGLGYCLHKLQEADCLSNVDNSLKSFDSELFKWFLSSLNKEYIDPLHGALGGLYYFTIRYKHNPAICNYVLNLWLDYLRNHLEKVSNGYTIGFRTFDRTPPYNLSLSHGLSGLITITVEALKKIPIKPNIEILEILKLLGDYLVHNVKITSNTISCTPSFGEINHYPNISRLGWCYGDLGVALALYKLGNLIECFEFVDVSREIITHASNRRRQQDTLIMDRCLCHGSCGVYRMFKYFNKYLFNGSLDDVEKYWFDYTYKDVIESPSQYITKFAYFDNQENKYLLKSNLLDGIAGLGLGMIPNSDIIDNLIFLT